MTPRLASFTVCIVATAVALTLVGCYGQDEAEAGPRAFRAVLSLSTNIIRVGDPLTLELRVDHPAGGRLSVPDMARGKDVIIRHRESRTEALDADWSRTAATFTLTSFTVGDHALPTGMVTYAVDGGDPLSTPFPAASFSVVSLLDDSYAVPRSMKGLASWPGVFPRWMWGLAVVAALALFAAAMARRFLLQPRTILHYPPPSPPHEAALRRLRELLAKGWIESATAEPFYVELSGIVRSYLEERFALRAPERTTEEFIREAANSRLLSDAHQQLVASFLEQCDLVKFARFLPASKAMRDAFQAAESLVRETIPPPQEAKG